MFVKNQKVYNTQKKNILVAKAMERLMKSHLTKRIIPCLDIKDGRVVKGVNFVGLQDAGDPVEIAARYNNEGADEITFLDITASHEKRDTIIDVLARVAKEVFIPLTVGGGIKNLDDIYRLLNVGCDKISINSHAIKNPDFINEASKRFGTSTMVVAIDVKKTGDSWNVFINGGRIDTGIDAVNWAKEVEDRGAGEILLTSMDADGTKKGYDLEILSKIATSTNIPIIASGGAGNMHHIEEAFLHGADAALAASIFHFQEIRISDLKQYLSQKNIEVRI
ncbi:MAG: imidazole glycerol-phosphate synthase subunit HisF [Campylobacterota bacterium]|nr:imidazole glycerol-phosphate synthase subunit HisF [Campylobacterota bacterium]